MAEALFEDPKPMHPPRDFLLLVRLQALAGGFQLIPWLDQVVAEPGWCQRHVRTVRSLLSPAGQTLSRSLRFCKKCHQAVGIEGRACQQCDTGTERCAGQFEPGGQVLFYPGNDWHRAFRFLLRHEASGAGSGEIAPTTGPRSTPRLRHETSGAASGEGRSVRSTPARGRASRFVDVLLADCTQPVYVRVTAQESLDALRIALDRQAKPGGATVLSPAWPMRPLFSRDLVDVDSIDGMIAFLDERATVTVEGVTVEEMAAMDEGGEDRDYLVVLDDLVPVTGYDWRDPEVACRHIRQTLEIAGVPASGRRLTVLETDVETVYLPVGTTARHVQPFFQRGSTLRLHLDGDANWRGSVVQALRTHGLRADNSGLGVPVSVYPPRLGPTEGAPCHTEI